MTERKIQDYIHLYPRHEIRYDDNYYGKKDLKGAVTPAIIEWAIYPEKWPKLSNVKLVLRPLSDMAHEEFVEAGKIHISEGGTIAVTFEEVRSNTVLPMRPKTFVYLLSKGFDLFGLIESNLAINKSTIQK